MFTMSTTMTSSMLRTRHHLSEDVRQSLVDLLDARLADTIALALQAKQAHWNVRGPRFLPLHELFDSIAAHAHEWADLLAERAGSLGGLVDGTPATVASRSRLPTYPEGPVGEATHVDQMIQALSTLSARMGEAIEGAAQAGDPATEDVFTEIARGIDQDFWFVEAHTQG
jgi:starvation-inducible DNA-binding protein